MKTRRTALAAIAILAAFSAHAEPLRVGLHLASVHTSPGFNNSNPGIYVRAANGFTAGVLRNSYRRTSAYAGWTWETKGRVTAALTVGAITGYPASDVMPLVVPSVAVHFGRAAVRMAVIPKPPSKGGAACFHLMVESAL